MKKFFVILIFSMATLCRKSNAQVTPCSSALNVEIISPAQSGSYNYFGVKVTLTQAYTTNVIVTGYIYDEDGPSNTDHPFEVTVTTGNTTDQTPYTFYQTGPSNNATIIITSITPYLVSNGSSFFNTSGYCTVNSQTVLDTTIILVDSLEAAHDFLNNTIELDDDEYVDFLISIVKNGVAATALSYNIDSNALYAYVDRSIQASESSIDFIRSSFFGSKPFDSLTNAEIIFLGNHLANANVAGKLAPEEIGTGCLGYWMGRMWTATLDFLEAMATFSTHPYLSQAEKDDLLRRGKLIYLHTMLVLVNRLVSCLS